MQIENAIKLNEIIKIKKGVKLRRERERGKIYINISCFYDYFS